MILENNGENSEKTGMSEASNLFGKGCKFWLVGYLKIFQGFGRWNCKLKLSLNALLKLDCLLQNIETSPVASVWSWLEKRYLHMKDDIGESNGVSLAPSCSTS